MSVTEKTIRRDLQAFQEAGFPLEETVGDHGRKSWRVHTGNGHPELSFGFDEALALYLGRRFLEPLAGTMLWDAAQSAFKKIRACLGKTALDYLEKMAAHLHQTSVGAGDYSQKADQIDQLMQAIEDRRATHISYRSQRSTEPVTYEIHPYGLAYHRGSLYLVAWSRDHGEVRHFKIDRLAEVEVSAFPFILPDGFDLKNHLSGSFGVFHGTGNIAVRVRFSSDVARYVQESTWHESQQLTPQKDGSLLAEFHLSSIEEIKRWLLSFGRHAVVLEPPALVREIHEELQETAMKYTPPKPRAPIHGKAK